MVGKNNYWLPFMGVNVPVFYGYERLAKKYDIPVFYIDSRKKKRGHYEVEIKLITEKSSNEPDFEIVKKYTKLVEAQIRQQPEYYLWTHKRWKHRDYPQGKASVTT
ncbi:lipid A biosynthesis acyltransferase [Elysia marginata]|uniref:Lipid A biosynthesis acyltransferase n=1 Tax=Elysia marginata TaxID=1093978 RepID=A0AAV4FR64_9GAST|nr:lipid A biosynthesis acyltransferase [Elysia marginata]